MPRGTEAFKKDLREFPFLQNRHTRYEITDKTVTQNRMARSAEKGVSNRKGYQTISEGSDERNIK